MCYLRAHGKNTLTLFCLQFVVRTRPDKRFIRTGNDLLYNATITLVDALLGFSIEVSSASCPQHGF